MDYKDLLNLWDEWKEKYGEDTYRYISQILSEAKEIHYRDWSEHPTANNDHEQSWRAFKGKNLEKLIKYIIEEQVGSLGLNIISGNTLERSKPENLSYALNKVRRNLLVRFGAKGEFGFHLPDADLIIYDPKSYKIIATISSKVTLRERIAQTGYWKIKLQQDKTTKDISVFFVTPDEDGTLTRRDPLKKGRAIVETDTDGAYVMSETEIEISDKVKNFDQFLIDLKALLK